LHFGTSVHAGDVHSAAPRSVTVSMRVLVLVPSVPTSLNAAAPWHFLQELRPLAARGHQVCVLSATSPDYSFPGVQFRSFAEFADVPRWRLGLESLPLAARDLAILPWLWDASRRRRLLRACALNFAVRRVIEDFRPDVLHSHWAAPAGTAGYLAAKAEGVPLVMTLRGIEHLKNARFGYGDCLDPLHEFMLTRALRHSAVITVCCQTTIRRLRELGVSGGDRLMRVYHAVDPERCEADPVETQAVRERLGIVGRCVVTCVALMDSPRKGHETLLQAFSQVVRRRSDREWALVLVGDGVIEGELRQSAAQLGIADKTHFVGRVHPKSVSHYLAASDFTVLPTHEEVFGNVVFESLAMGVPVISGEVGAAADVLPQGPYGMLVPPGDASALSSAMLSMVAQMPIWRDRAAMGRAIVREQMTIDRRIAGFLSAYHRATGSDAQCGE
jgi:glycosyltransferase involved in cell wall biosynthesis